MKSDRTMRYMLAAALIAACVFCGRCAADIAISPARVEVRLDRGRPAGEFIISNLGDREERYRVQSIHFSFSRKGALDRIPPDEHSLAPWIIFNPKEFTLPAKTRRVVRFVIVPKGQLRPGEYWAGMELESLNTVTTQSTTVGGARINLEVISKILVPMFGQVGDVSYAGVIRDTKVTAQGGKTAIETVVANTGNGRLLLLGQYEIADSSGRIVEKGSLSEGTAYVFPNQEREFKAQSKVALSGGRYQLRLRYESDQLAKPLTDAIEFDWTPPVAKPEDGHASGPA